MTDDPRPGVPRVGVLLPTREHALAGDFAAAPLLEFARRAEQLGFDSVWAGDSLTARPRLDPLVLLSAVGAVTSEVTLGTAALTAALRPPLAGANTIAALDQVCDSRLVLGLGAGFPIPESEAEFAAAGVPFEGRVGRLDETAALWRAAWRSTRQGAPTGFEGAAGGSRASTGCRRRTGRAGRPCGWRAPTRPAYWNGWPGSTTAGCRSCPRPRPTAVHAGGSRNWPWRPAGPRTR